MCYDINMYPDFERYQITNLDSLYDFCQSIDYGWVDRSGRKHFETNHSATYFLQSPAELLQNQIGICWDQTELQRAWFSSQGIPVETYFLYYYISDDNCPSHSILTFTKHGKPHWFEPMFKNTAVYYAGIHGYDSIDDLLAHFRTKFVRNGQASGFLPADFHLENLELYRYSRPTYGISGPEFYNHCRTGERILIQP